MAIDALHVWHVAMRWTAPPPFPSSFHEWNFSVADRTYTSGDAQAGGEGGGQRVHTAHCCPPLSSDLHRLCPLARPSIRQRRCTGGRRRRG